MGALIGTFVAMTISQAVLAAIVCSLLFWVRRPRIRALLTAFAVWGAGAGVALAMSGDADLLALCSVTIPLIYVAAARVLEMAREDDAYETAAPFR
jgi:hypothetical protein